MRYVIALLIPDFHVGHVQAARARARLAARERIGSAIAVRAPALLDLGERELLCRQRLAVIRLTAVGCSQLKGDTADFDGVSNQTDIVVVRSVRAAAVREHNPDQLGGNGIGIRADLLRSCRGYTVFGIGHVGKKGVFVKHDLMSLSLKAAQLRIAKIARIGSGDGFSVILFGDGVKFDLKDALIDGQRPRSRQNAFIPIGGVYRLAKSFLVHDTVLDRVRAHARVGLRTLRADNFNRIARKQRAAYHTDQIPHLIFTGIQRLCIVRLDQSLK